MPNVPKNNLSPKNKKSLSAAARYSGLAFQMLGTMLLGTAGGWWIDKHWSSIGFPVFTFIAVILSVVLAIYLAIKDLLKK